jgi:hypothetical protein
MKKLLWFSAVALAAALVTVPGRWGRVSAQEPAPAAAASGSIDVVASIEPKPSGSPQRPLLYVMPFTCGTVAANAVDPRLPADLDAPVSPGTYLTAINIQFPRPPGVGGAAALLLRAVAANPRFAESGKISPLAVETLIPNESVTVDCAEILRLLGRPGGPAGPFVSGSLQIFSDSAVEVSAIYTQRS